MPVLVKVKGNIVSYCHWFVCIYRHNLLLFIYTATSSDRDLNTTSIYFICGAFVAAVITMIVTVVSSFVWNQIKSKFKLYVLYTVYHGLYIHLEWQMFHLPLSLTVCSWPYPLLRAWSATVVT